MTTFSSPETLSLERQAERTNEKVSIEEIWSSQETESIKWITHNSFTKIALQFPDNLLCHSSKIYEDLEKSCNAAKFFILADTSYGSCCVDEVAAGHVEADAIIHFGNACLSKSSRIPVFYVFANLAFDSENFLEQVKTSLPSNENNIVIYFDTGYHYVIDKIDKQIQELPASYQKFPSADSLSEVTEEHDVCIFVGQDSQAFFNLSLSAKSKKYYIYDPKNLTLKETNPGTTNWLRRRSFYIEKVKDAQTIGLVVATLTADGYLDIVKRMQEMARSRGIRTFLISVGRINSAKLANFMEIDCFVLIGCPYNNLYVSRDFFKPIVSVFEAEMALNPAWHNTFPDSYATNFKDILPDGKLFREFRKENIGETDVSLISGRVRGGATYSDKNSNDSNSLVEKKNHQIMERNTGTVFEDRSWQGLDQQLGRTEPAKIEKGLSGIPTNYTHD